LKQEWRAMNGVGQFALEADAAHRNAGIAVRYTLTGVLRRDSGDASNTGISFSSHAHLARLVSIRSQQAEQVINFLRRIG
jgi:hypothetical protein